MSKPWSFLTRLLVVAVLCGGIMAPAAAYAWGRGGWGWGGGGVYFGFAPPVYIGPPAVYVGPPVVYAPPPGYGYGAPPPGYGAPAPSGPACYAGAYVCPLDKAGPPGAPCTCPANNGRVGGMIR